MMARQGLSSDAGLDREAGGTTIIQRPISLADEVYETIFSQLMALRIAPGARITVDNMARELGVSPVGVALV